MPWQKRSQCQSGAGSVCLPLSPCRSGHAGTPPTHSRDWVLSAIASTHVGSSVSLLQVVQTAAVFSPEEQVAAAQQLPDHRSANAGSTAERWQAIARLLWLSCERPQPSSLLLVLLSALNPAGQAQLPAVGWLRLRRSSSRSSNVVPPRLQRSGCPALGDCLRGAAHHSELWGGQLRQGL